MYLHYIHMLLYLLQAPCTTFLSCFCNSFLRFESNLVVTYHAPYYARTGGLPDTRLDHHENWGHFRQETSCKPHFSLCNSLHNSDVEKHLLNSADVSSLLGPEATNSFLVASLSHFMALAGSYSINKLLGISCSQNLDYRQFTTNLTDLKGCRDVSDCIVKNQKHSWLTSILPRTYYHVVTLALCSSLRQKASINSVVTAPFITYPIFSFLVLYNIAIPCLNRAFHPSFYHLDPTSQ